MFHIDGDDVPLESVERLTQNVFAGVLLHVIQAPRPVELPSDFSVQLEAAVNRVPDAAVLLGDIDDSSCTEPACVAGLSTSRRVKRAALEPDFLHAFALSSFNNCAGEVLLVSVEAV